MTYRVAEQLLLDTFSRPVSFTNGTLNAMGWMATDIASSSGTPTTTAADSNNGGIVVALTNDSEQQSYTLDRNGIEQYDIDTLDYADFVVSVSGVDSVTEIVFGLADARNTAPDSVANSIWFKIAGAGSTSAVVAEWDDTANTADDQATGVTLSSTPKHFRIDFSNGKSDVRLYAEDSNGQLKRVVSGTTISMASCSVPLQPYFGVHKASGTGVPAITINRVELWGRRVYA